MGVPTIAVVILTFDKPDRLRASLKAISGGTDFPDKVIIVNTGKMQLAWAQEEFPSLGIELLRFENIGPAGGFKEGAKHAFAAGYDYIIQADDDAIPSSGSIGFFRSNARKGRLVVAGYYTSGAKVVHSNHYFMIHRCIFEKAGFYFAPFFFMNEDIEFPSRLARLAELYNDPGIVIHHPFYPEIETRRHYYYLRNSLVHTSATGNLGSFLLIQGFLLSKSIFFLSLLHSADFISAFFNAYLDFLAGRLGKSDGIRKSFEIPKAGNPPHDSGAILILGDMDKEKVASGPLPREVVRAEVFSGQIRYASPGRLMTEMLRMIWRLRGKDLLIVHPLLAAFPPFSLLAKSVCVHDEKENCFRLLFRNTVLMQLLVLLIIPAVALATIPGILFFWIKGGAYKKMFETSKAEDLEFCRRNAKVS
jgi:GT2 family glycosyltransferase